VAFPGNRPYLPPAMRTPIAIALILLGGCNRPATSPDPNGLVSVRWTGAVQGQLAAIGAGRWCAADSLLEVVAVDSVTDHAVGFSLLMQDSLRPGQHPIVAGSVAANWRPLGFAAFRWASDTALKGYEATGGTITVSAATPAAVSGTVDLRLRLSQGIDTVNLTGSFTTVPILPASAPCGRLVKIRQG